MFRKMLIGAVALVALVAAPAAAQYDFTVSPGQVEQGGTVSVSGKACNPGAEVTITMTQLTNGQATGDAIVVATLTADENGEFTATFDLPPGLAVGTYVVTYICDGVAVDDQTITVVSPSTATTSPPSNDDPIVRTGSDLNGLGLVGAGLLTAGGLMLIATKTRRRHAEV